MGGRRHPRIRPPLRQTPYDLLPDSVRGRTAGWYRGDLHLHSVHSDGARTVDRMVVDARGSGLDFIATSDHNTSSTGVSWHGNIPSDLLVINAEEVTTRHGHWLAVGLPQGEWVDWRYAPGDRGALDRHVQRVHSLGGLVVAAHPTTPGPGSFWEFGLDHVDAMEVWNGPWTLDDAANVALWHGVLCAGKRLPGLGNSDSHATTDTIGLPHNVVHASALSTTAILTSLRQGRSYAAESASVTVDFTASGAGRTAGPGEELPLGFFDAVDVTASVSGAPDTVVTLYTEWGIMASTAIGAGGTGQLRWRGWGKASLFARAEVRRLQPGSSTLDQMVAITNPVWFYAANRPPYAVEKRVLFQSARKPDGNWTGMRPLRGVASESAFAGIQVSAAGMPDGSVQVLGLQTDNSLWWATLDGPSLSRPWQRLDGPGGQKDFTAREAAVGALPDGTSQIVATSMDGTLYHQQRRADGTSAGFRPVPGFTPGSTWGATKVALAGMPDGSTQVLAYHTDGAMHLIIRRRTGPGRRGRVRPGSGVRPPSPVRPCPSRVCRTALPKSWRSASTGTSTTRCATPTGGGTASHLRRASAPAVWAPAVSTSPVCTTDRHRWSSSAATVRSGTTSARTTSPGPASPRSPARAESTPSRPARSASPPCRTAPPRCWASVPRRRRRHRSRPWHVQVTQQIRHHPGRQ